MMIKYCVVLLVNLCLLSNHLQAQSVQLVKDITPGPESTFSSDFVPVDDGILFGFGTHVLFVVKDAAKNFNLWLSDGEEDGTKLLHGLSAGSSFKGFVNGDDGNVYYGVQTPVGSYLYSLSKASLDTVRIFSNPEKMNFLTYLNGQLFFESKSALMRFDPNTKQSALVFQFGTFVGIRDIGTLNNKLILIGEKSFQTHLYSSDGTQTGTKSYYKLNEGSEFSGDYYMTEVGGKLFFFYNKPSEPYTLHVTDGTAGGTLPLVQLERITFVNLEKNRSIFGWNGKLFFRGRALGNFSNQDELYVSDGTVSGTQKININSSWSKPAYFTPYNGKLYFMADDLGYVFNVYRTDGTQAGTVRAIDPWDLGSGNSYGGNFMVEHNDSLYFYAVRNSVGEELWVSGGTTTSTACIDIVPGSNSSVPSQMTSTDNYLFLLYESQEYGKELFVLEPGSVSTTESFTDQIRIYPNPFTDYIQIDGMDGYNNLTLDILDVDGKQVFSRIVQSGKVEFPELPSGVYFAVLKMDGISVEKTLIKR